MSLTNPKYETYQDLKDTLAWWGTPIWFLVGSCIWLGLLSETHRKTITELLPSVATWLANTGFLVGGLVLAGVVSHVLVHILEIHDHVYDRYIIKWRQQYAATFIIPRLLDPYKDRAGSDLETVAQQNHGEFLRELFYHFVGDRDTRIRSNLVVRVYEVLAKYWITQLAEIAFFSLTLMALIWIVFSGSLARSYVIVLAIGLVGFAISRALALLLRKVSIPPATEAEILDIWRCCSMEHEEHMRRFCEKHGVELRSA
jgi:hypothetical protein